MPESSRAFFQKIETPGRPGFFYIFLWLVYGVLFAHASCRRARYVFVQPVVALMGKFPARLRPLGTYPFFGKYSQEAFFCHVMFHRFLRRSSCMVKISSQKSLTSHNKRTLPA